MTKRNWITIGIGVVLSAAVLGLGLGCSAVQDSATVAHAESAAAAATATPVAPVNELSNELESAFWSALASNLSLSADDLKTQFVAAEKSAIEQAVTDGKLTSDQATQMEQQLSSDPLALFSFGGPGGAGPGQAPGGGRGGGFLNSLDTLEAEATALNLTPAELTTKLQSGKTLADIATAQSVTAATLKQAIVDSIKTQIQREVTDGVLTQTQADKLLSSYTVDQIDLSGKQTGMGQGTGMPGGPGQGMPGGPGPGGQGGPNTQ